MSYAKEVITKAEQKFSEQPEFLQAVKEVLSSLEPIIEKN